MVKRRGSWSQPIRVEIPDIGWLCTSKCVNSRLWLVNNSALETRILACLAKYQRKYGVTLYSFVIQGNHYHLIATFPKCNKSQFFRDFNARIAEAVRHYVKNFEGGPLFGRRYTPQGLPLEGDVFDKFYYCALQPVSAELTERVSDYPGYNSFSDAASGINRQFKFFRRADYNAAKRYNSRVKKKDFTEVHTLEYSKLPGYEHLTRGEYRKVLHAELEARRVKLIEELKKEGKTSFLSKSQLSSVRPGSRPVKPKNGGRRPLVTTACKEARERFLSFYFQTLDAYWKASAKYLSGESNVSFPPGTYKPPGPFVAYQ